MSRRPLEDAVVSLGRMMLAAGIVAVLGVVIGSVLLHLGIGEAAVALTLALAVLAAQWYFVQKAIRDANRSPVWVMVSYLTKIVLIVVGLYVPQALGMQVRFPAMVVVIAVVVAAASEVIIMMRLRQFTVEIPAEDGVEK